VGVVGGVGSQSWEQGAASRRRPGTGERGREGEAVRIVCGTRDTIRSSSSAAPVKMLALKLKMLKRAKSTFGLLPRGRGGGGGKKGTYADASADASAVASIRRTSSVGAKKKKLSVFGFGKQKTIGQEEAEVKRPGSV